MSLLEQLQLTESAIYANTDVAEVVNELAVIQDKCIRLEGTLDFTPEMVPVTKLEGITEDGKDLYCFDANHFKSMLKSEKKSIVDGVRAMYDQIKMESDIEDISDMAIIVNEEDIDSIYDKIVSDPSMLNIRCESVANHVDFINDVKSTGCQIILR